MNMTKWFTIVLLLSLCSNAFGTCSNRDLLGAWTFTAQGSGIKKLCTVQFKQDGTVVASGSSCAVHSAMGGAPTSDAFTGGSLSIGSDCTFTGSFTFASGETGALEGLLSRDAQAMVAVSVDGFSIPSTIQGLKWQ